MGIHDRDYYRRSLPRGGFGYFSAWSVTTWLIVANLLVYFACGVLGRVFARPGGAFDGLNDAASPEAMRQVMLALMSPLERWGYFSLDKAVYAGQVWRFFTFQFLHASLIHLLGNMVGLYFFGPIVETHFGRRRYLAFYLLCGLAGAFSYVFLAFTHVIRIEPWQPMIGASAGIFGLLVAAAIIAPDVQVFYYLIPITVRMLAIAGMLLAAYAVFASIEQANSGGEAAHLGGGVLGFLLMKNQHWLNLFGPRRSQVSHAGTEATRRRQARASQKDWSKDFNR
jgi:membrane associated rhomboid family serine protease